MSNISAEFNKYITKMRGYGVAADLLCWDQETGAPKGGSSEMAKIIGALTEDEFGMSVSPKMKEYLDALERETGLDEVTAGCYRRCKREYDKQAKVPPAEMGKFTELTMNSQSAWEKAKENDDFAAFAPYLRQVIAYRKKFIEYRSWSGHPYNTLLDDYEPGMTVEILDEYFAKLKAGIVPLLNKITTGGKTFRSDFTRWPVDKATQQELAYFLLDVLGYDLNRGKLAESVHPFSNSFNMNDSRITTNYHIDEFLSSYFSVAHEFGHALYEMNKREDLCATLMDEGASMGVHESQSRFYENIVCRSREFWGLIGGRVKEILGSRFDDVTADEFYRASNIVKPSLIRIEADELTYSLHIMVRYELEKLIFSGAAEVEDLPLLWKDKYEEYLGVRPATDAEGILQDVHWSGGDFGYFPSYSLGNAYGAQLRHYMMKDFDMYAAVAEGRIDKITSWLKEKIHRHGMLYTPNELILKATGEQLNAEYFVKYLEEKYGKLYGV